MSNEDEIPTVPTDLIEWLETAYAPRIPQPDRTMSDLFFQAGMSELVQRLRLIHNDQHERE